MSSYVMNFEELLFQGLSANEMTQPLSAIICVAIFPVNLPLQEKSCIYCNSSYLFPTADNAFCKGNYHINQATLSFCLQYRNSYLNNGQNGVFFYKIIAVREDARFARI